MIFSDGNSVVCDGDHRWPTYYCGNRFSVRTVQDMYDMGTVREGCNRSRKFSVDVADPIQLPEADLRILPYILGVWLSTGIDGGHVVLAENSPVWNELQSLGVVIGEPAKVFNKTGVAREIDGLGDVIASYDLGMDKRIPHDYMYSSVNQRLSLLRGIMDGCGVWWKNGSQKRNAVYYASYTSRDHVFALQLRALIESLGNKVTWKEHKLSRGISYTIRFAPRVSPFIALHKNEGLRVGRSALDRRQIESIAPVETVPTQCITVDSKDHTYLCGESFLKTHNTINDNGFQSLKTPLRKHVLQLTSYLVLEDYKYGILLYINKNDDSLKEFLVKQSDIAWIVEKFGKVRDALDTNNINELQYECVHGSRQWEHCPYHDICYAKVQRTSRPSPWD